MQEDEGDEEEEEVGRKMSSFDEGHNGKKKVAKGQIM